VVDDEPENLDYVRRCLRKDFDVVTANSPEQALALLGNGHYDVIVSDQRMPGMNGSQFLSRSLATTPASIRIIITGYSDLDATIDAINHARVAGFVRKPFTDNELRRVITDAGAERAVSGDAAQPRFRAVLDSLPDGVAVAQSGQVQWSNAVLGQLLGCHPEAILHRPLVDLVHADDRDLVAHATGEVFVRLVRADESIVPVALTHSTLAGAPGEVYRIRPLVRTAESRTEPRGKKRILLIDNEPRILRALRRSLAPHCRVEIARNADEALTVLEADRHFDLVLCDVFLDDQTAAELHERLRTAAPEMAGRMALMTADIGIDERTADTGLPLLFKPFEVGEVLELAERR
jgi:DNA-binding NtrC family response regulator